MYKRQTFAWFQAYFLNQEELICYGTDRQRFGLNENPRFYLVNLESGEKTPLTPDLDCSIGSSVGSDCRYGGGRSSQLHGGYLYFTTTEGHSSYLNRIDRSGRIESCLLYTSRCV